MSHRCWAEIDLDAIRRNAAACRAAAPEGCGLYAIVKAGAYGHGLASVAGALAGRVGGFGVANLAEAQELAGALGDRAERERDPILILSPLLPDERVPAVAEGFAISVSDESEVEAFAAAAAETHTVARLHAVADTGMGRIGAVPDRFPALVRRILERTGSGHAIRLCGVATHFPSADEDAEFTLEQIAAFLRLIESVNLPDGVEVHLANSAGLLGFSGKLGFSTRARTGLALYGVSPLPEFQVALSPALAWKTRVTLVRDLPAGATISYGRTYTAPRPIRVATLAAGYGDGYPRSLSGRGADVLIAGCRCPLLGRVTMDQVMVDVSDLPAPPRPGDEAVLLGRQGSQEVTATELAEKAGTIPWEIFTGITGRVARVPS